MGLPWQGAEATATGHLAPLLPPSESVTPDWLGHLGRCTAGRESGGGLSLVAGLADGTGCLRARRLRVVWRLFECRREPRAGRGTGRDMCCFLKRQRARLAGTVLVGWALVSHLAPAGCPALLALWIPPQYFAPPAALGCMSPMPSESPHGARDRCSMRLPTTLLSHGGSRRHFLHWMLARNLSFLVHDQAAGQQAGIW